MSTLACLVDPPSSLNLLNCLQDKQYLEFRQGIILKRIYCSPWKKKREKKKRKIQPKIRDLPGAVSRFISQPNWLMDAKHYLPHLNDKFNFRTCSISAGRWKGITFNGGTTPEWGGGKPSTYDVVIDEWSSHGYVQETADNFLLVSYCNLIKEYSLLGRISTSDTLSFESALKEWTRTVGTLVRSPPPVSPHAPWVVSSGGGGNKWGLGCRTSPLHINMAEISFL